MSQDQDMHLPFVLIILYVALPVGKLRYQQVDDWSVLCFPGMVHCLEIWIRSGEDVGTFWMFLGESEKLLFPENTGVPLGPVN